VAEIGPVLPLDNEDAMLCCCCEVLPLIRAEEPGVTTVGAEGIIRLASHRTAEAVPYTNPISTVGLSS
jgi:hypothetical protein